MEITGTALFYCGKSQRLRRLEPFRAVEFNQRLVAFALSNPTSKWELSAGEAHRRLADAQ